MKPEEKKILINAILIFLQENIKKKNKELVKGNLYWKQEPFDAGDMFLKLAFMDDAEIKKIASLILD